VNRFSCHRNNPLAVAGVPATERVVEEDCGFGCGFGLGRGKLRVRIAGSLNRATMFDTTCAATSTKRFQVARTNVQNFFDESSLITKLRSAQPTGVTQ
jgi:hypothetical protein